MNENGALSFVFASHPPIGHCILQYLAPIDYICLSQSVASIRRRYPSTVDFLFSRIKRALMKRLGDEMGNAFAQYLYPNHLTGGFLLSVLNGDEIRPEQDIDVIMAKNYEFENVLRPWLGEEEEYYSEGYRQDTTLKIVTYRTLETNCKIQFIYYRHWKEHINGYDLEFCKNVANSDNFYIVNVATIIKRRCIFSVLSYVLRYVDYDRYDDSEERCRKLFTNVQNRIQKYRLRGYEVTIVDNSAADIVKCLSWPEMELPEHWFNAKLWSELK